MAYSLPATPVALGLAVALAASPLTPAAAQESTVPTAMPDHRGLSHVELMALPPFERSHELCKRHSATVILYPGNPEVTIRQYLTRHKKGVPLDRALHNIRFKNSWREDEVTLDTVIPPGYCFVG